MSVCDEVKDLSVPEWVETVLLRLKPKKNLIQFSLGLAGKRIVTKTKNRAVFLSS